LCAAHGGLNQCPTVNELNSKWHVYTEHKTCITHNNMTDQMREGTVNKQTNKQTNKQSFHRMSKFSDGVNMVCVTKFRVERRRNVEVFALIKVTAKEI
jgi:hypothetical protein